ncbi:hypothetical protein [Aneurinibacillus terranovensis]|uniref:hypothetical protein n=1 Tax=Aneurinibacillus terranovensis TaxID=278991 RepID=UPI000424662D|nr:hypothetical protein [Aneurinibacillus terranovensis]
MQDIETTAESVADILAQRLDRELPISERIYRRVLADVLEDSDAVEELEDRIRCHPVVQEVFSEYEWKKLQQAKRVDKPFYFFETPGGVAAYMRDVL